eukprot:8338-Heterococcus_DN1.PRE.5
MHSNTAVLRRLHQLMSTMFACTVSRHMSVLHTPQVKVLATFVDEMSLACDKFMTDVIGSKLTNSRNGSGTAEQGAAVVAVYEPVRRLLIEMPLRLILGLGDTAPDVVSQYVGCQRLSNGAAALTTHCVRNSTASTIPAHSAWLPITQYLLYVYRVQAVGAHGHLQKRLLHLMLLHCNSHYQLQKLIEQRRSEGCENKTDTLSEMISNVSSTGDRLSDEEIQDQVITLMLAGYETTVGAVCGALYLLPLYPEIIVAKVARTTHNEVEYLLCECYAQVLSSISVFDKYVYTIAEGASHSMNVVEKLRAEQDAITTPVTWDYARSTHVLPYAVHILLLVAYLLSMMPLPHSDCRQMDYFAKFLKEVLRLKPAVPGFFKSVIEEFEFDGYTVCTSDVYVYHTAAVQRDACDDSEKCIPERYNDPNCPLNQPYMFTPFGGGEVGRERSSHDSAIYTNATGVQYRLSVTAVAIVTCSMLLLELL